MTDTNSTEWGHTTWICPRCGDEDHPSCLQLVDSRDLSVRLRDVWEGEYNPELHRQRYATDTVVYCPDCETVFDVDFVPREVDED